MGKTIPQISAQYSDVKPILDAALAQGGGTYEAPTPGAAVQFRHRCYAFRKAFREASESASPYDRLVLRKLRKGETRVRIEPNILPGTFVPAGGTPIETYAVEDDDPLLDEAAQLRQSLGLE